MKNSCEKIKNNIVIKSKCSISNTMDGTEDDDLFDQDIESNDDIFDSFPS